MEVEKEPHMGEGSAEVFTGNSSVAAIHQTYGNTAQLFAQQINNHLKNDRPYVLLDAGSSRGELLGGLLAELPDFIFETIAIDINDKILLENKPAKRKIVASLDNIPLADKSVDVTIARYILQWNYFERQKNILKELSRVTKEFVLVEHSGADSQTPDKWRQAYTSLFSGDKVVKMKREEQFYSSRLELESLMEEMGIKFEKLQERKIDNPSDIFITRYRLDSEEAQLTKQILGEYDYFIQTDWIIYPN
jgi:ubiquinone/menaquinone biosynthesis C-methylase UbiE